MTTQSALQYSFSHSPSHTHTFIQCIYGNFFFENITVVRGNLGHKYLAQGHFDLTLHTALSHLDLRDTYVRMLFIDYSSAFNTIMPLKLVTNAWYGSCTALNRKALQRVVKPAQHITRKELPSMEDLYTQRCRKKTNRIIKDPYHLSHKLFRLLSSGRRYRSIWARTTRLRDSFIPQAIRLLDSSNLP